ncbi:SDR family oxidoreductase, partial [Rhizobium ruizarguesonis]
LTKGALLTLAKTLSGELIGRGIRVNAVSPGTIATPLYSKLGASEAQSKAMAEQIQARIPGGRFGKPSEVAKTIVVLASEEAAYIVGSELIIDGGMSNL